MSYIGQTLPADTFQGFVTDKFTGDGTANKTFTLSKTPFNESAILVTIDGVVQEATDDFTVSGTTLTLVGTAPNNSEVNAIHIGGALPIGQAASLDLNGASDQLILDADADTTISADTDDQIDFKIAGADDFQMTANTFTAQSGSTIVTPKITLNTTGTTSVSSLMCDQFRLNTTLQVTGSTNQTITANLERADTSGTDTILGTGMTESSGLFTFPSTGFYLVSAVGNFSKYGAAAAYAGIQIRVTVDNSSYLTRAESYNYIPDVGSAYGCVITRCLVDVTSTTNVKVLFRIVSSATVQLYGHSSNNATHFMFQRVGDT